MKKHLTLVAVLLSIATAVSCKKSEECESVTKTSEIETTIVTHEQDPEMRPVDDTMFTKDMASETPVAPRKQYPKAKTTEKAKAQSYLSNPAPDGTDAENYDDDYYTRNDTMHRPTGTSIK